ncbi:hypothetical protein XENOCAPTIV_011415, partial [Xenoophorus captivus]
MLKRRCIGGGGSNTTTAVVSLHYFSEVKRIRACVWITAGKLMRDRWAGPTKHSQLLLYFLANCFEQETSDFTREIMSEVGISYRQRRMFKADAIATLFSASDEKRSPKKRFLLVVAKWIKAQQVRTLPCHKSTFKYQQVLLILNNLKLLFYCSFCFLVVWCDSCRLALAMLQHL